MQYVRLNVEISYSQSCATAAKKLADIKLADDEKLILLDLESTVNAADIESEFSDYAGLIMGSEEQRRGDSATSACGGVIEHLGKARGEAAITDTKGNLHDFDIVFNHMKGKLPILSLRNFVKRKNSVRINEHGGYIKNKLTGATIPVYEHHDVYYVKIEVKKPSSQPNSSTDSDRSGFARQGRWMITSVIKVRQPRHPVVFAVHLTVL